MEKYKLWRKCKARCGQKRLSGLVQNRHANLKYMVLLKAIILIDDLIVTDNKPTTTALTSHNQYILTIILMRNTVNDCWESSNLICLLGTLILWRTRRPDGLAKNVHLITRCTVLINCSIPVGFWTLLVILVWLLMRSYYVPILFRSDGKYL